MARVQAPMVPRLRSKKAKPVADDVGVDDGDDDDDDDGSAHPVEDW
jgi:hypothetical protein